MYAHATPVLAVLVLFSLPASAQTKRVLPSGSASTATSVLYPGSPTRADPLLTHSVSLPGQGPRVRGAGDVNGDGFDYLIIGSPYNNVEYGEASIYLGSPSGITTAAPVWSLAGVTRGRLGYSVDSAGDVNCDGFDDVILSEAGSVFVFHGSATGPAAVADWTATGGFYRIWVAGAGDVNGDGYSDVVVGDYQSSTAQMFLGSASGLSVAPDWTYSSATADALGFSVASAGDVNMDGYDDVLVGAPDANAGVGEALRFLGGWNGLQLSPSWVATSPSGSCCFGHSVAGAGDLNGDGFGDIAVTGPTVRGFVKVYYGGASGPSTDADWTYRGTLVDFLGWSVDGAGDLDEDGLDELIFPVTTRGYFLVFRGSAAGVSSLEDSRWVSPTVPGHVSWVAGLGDVNGDGTPDVVVGSSYGVDVYQGHP